MVTLNIPSLIKELKNDEFTITHFEILISVYSQFKKSFEIHE